MVPQHCQTLDYSSKTGKQELIWYRYPGGQLCYHCRLFTSVSSDSLKNILVTNIYCYSCHFLHFFPRKLSTLVTDATVWITGLSITQSFPSYCYWVRPQQSSKMSWQQHFTTLFAVYAVKFPLARPALNLSDCSKCIHYSESHRVFIVRQLDTQQIIMLYRALLVLQTYWMESAYPPTLDNS